jgi:MFS family permease
MWRDRQLRALMLYYAVATLFVVGPCQIGFPLLAHSRLGYGVSSLATLLTAFSAGTFVGVAVAGAVSPPRFATLGTVILLVDTLCGVALAALGYANSVLSGGLLCVGMGFGSGYVQVALVTWIQKRIPLEVLGRTMSVLTSISLVSAPVSVFLIGVLIEISSVPASFAITGTSLAVTALIALLSPTLRSIQFVPEQSAAP